jgi:hypothetical protein
MAFEPSLDANSPPTCCLDRDVREGPQPGNNCLIQPY